MTNIGKNENRIHAYALPALLVLFFGIYFFNLFGEKLFYYSNGLGIDGEIYGRMVRNLPQCLYNGTIEPYWYQKVFPVIIARGILELSGMHIDNPMIVKAYTLINAGCITGSVLLYFVIAKKLHFSLPKRTMGFLLLFFNFGLLKFAPYEPLLNDSMALLLSFILLYCYLVNNWKLGFFFSFLGLFTFPLVIWLTAAVLFSFKKTHKAPDTVNTPFRIIALCLALSPAIITAYNYFFNFERFDFYSYYGLAVISLDSVTGTVLLVISLLAVSWFLFLGFKMMFKLINVKDILQYIYWNRLILFVGQYALLKVILHLFTNNEIHQGRSSFHFIENISYQSLIYPLGFLISHFMFFGSIVLLFCFGARKYLNRISIQDNSIFLLMLFNFFFLISTESREFIYLLPFVGYIVLQNINEKVVNNNIFLSLIFIVNLTVSLFWFKINVPGIYEPVKNKLAFPWQRFYMILGPWRNTEMFTLFGVVTLLSAALIWYQIKRTNTALVKQLPGNTLDYEQK